jgi:hypothetical protein
MFCGGCAELMLSPIYSNVLVGGLLGGIIGHQSGEPAAGALVGAAITGTGELLSQTDRLNRQKQQEQEAEEIRLQEQAEQEQDQEPQREQQVIVVEVTNSNGSKTPVQLTKQGDIYIGPKGEHYDQLPIEEQLWTVYGF